MNKVRSNFIWDETDGKWVAPPRPVPPLGPVYEGGKLVGHNSLAWNNDGTKQVRVFIPAGDVE